MIVDRFVDRFPFWRTWHPYVLARKGLATDAELSRAIEIDIASSLVSVNELRTAGVSDVVTRLSLPSGFLLYRAGDALDHLGFRIHTPMDVYLEVLPLLVEEQGWALGGTKRFAPSRRFQERVGATAEMAQAWVEADGVVVELELFDIHAPPSGERAAISEAAALLGNGEIPGATQWAAFAVDDIWHYGVRLAGLPQVEELHAALVRVQNGSIILKNQEVVVNLWHGSHHTKVAGGEPEIEIEFLAYIDDWSTVA